MRTQIASTSGLEKQFKAGFSAETIGGGNTDRRAAEESFRLDSKDCSELFKEGTPGYRLACSPGYRLLDSGYRLLD